MELTVHRTVFPRHSQYFLVGSTNSTKNEGNDLTNDFARSGKPNEQTFRSGGAARTWIFHTEGAILDTDLSDRTQETNQLDLQL